MRNQGYMTWEEFEKKLFKQPGFKEAAEETRLEYEIARALIKARLDKGLTQKQLASKLKTRQSVISRVENAKTVPSLSLLKRLAEVLNLSLQVQFK